MQHSTLAALFYYEIITWQPGYSHVLAHVFNVIHERFNFYNAGNKLVYILTPACNRTARAFIHVCVCMCIWLAVGAYIQVFLFFRFFLFSFEIILRRLCNAVPYVFEYYVNTLLVVWVKMCGKFMGSKNNAA